MTKTYLTVTAIFLTLAGFVAWHTFGAGHVYAQESPSQDVHQSMMSGLSTSQKDSTITMMKSHHGENWKEGCTKMMNNLN